MSVAGIGSLLNDTGSQYDFTKMTNKQLYAAATTLQSDGRISVDQMSTMQYVAQGGNHIPKNGGGPSYSEVLNEVGTTNFASEFQAMYKSMSDTPGSVGVGLFKSIADLMAAEDGTSSSSGLSISA